MEIVEASPEKPFLVAGFGIDRVCMADVLLRLDQIDDVPAKPASIDPSGVFSISLNGNLLDPLIRLFKSLDNPKDAAMLGASIVDEIYYRLLSRERGGELRFLLQQRGEIRRISKVVEYIHQNLDKAVSVEDLATMGHMSRTAFYQNFKDVMHLDPYQYAKSVKLYEAQRLLKEGKKPTKRVIWSATAARPSSVGSTKGILVFLRLQREWIAFWTPALCWRSGLTRSDMNTLACAPSGALPGGRSVASGSKLQNALYTGPERFVIFGMTGSSRDCARNDRQRFIGKPQSDD